MNPHERHVRFGTGQVGRQFSPLIRKMPEMPYQFERPLRDVARTDSHPAAHSPDAARHVHPRNRCVESSPDLGVVMSNQ